NTPKVLADSRTIHLSLVLICDIYEMTEQGGRGGFARLAGAIAAERARTPNVIVAHAGDTISPSLFSGFDQGAHVIDLTNMIAPDVFVPGNHEFDFGEDIYRKRMGEARFPILAANLRDRDGKRLAGHEDVKNFTFEGVKIAVIGLTADDSPQKSSPGTLRFEASVPLAKRLAPELRDKGADIVVAVAHANRRQDVRLFYSHALDILLSGDDHDLALLYDGHSAMVEAMAEGEFVTAIDLEITVKQSDDGSRAVVWRPRFRIIDTADVQPDPKVAKRVGEYQKFLSKELDVPIGKTATNLDSRKASVRSAEAAIGNLFTDAMRERVGADVAIMNGGGIRGNKTYAAGAELTRRDILTELPFGDKLFMVEMTGAELIKALENGFRLAGKPDGRFPQLSGATARVRISAVPGKRVQSVEIGGKPVEPDKFYRVAANDFIVTGKEGYDAFKRAKLLIGETDGPLVANVVMDHIRKEGTIRPAAEGRIVME
ncbi:MAG: bifunctional metallophosphatase/5'-nucleotidase, partial [Methyloligellaceae bacterium]